MGQASICKKYENRIEWRNHKGQLHREDGPAIEYTDDGYELWYRNGTLHREDGPAIEWRDGGKEWYKNRERHREDGPAVEYTDGTKEWWIYHTNISKILKQSDTEIANKIVKLISIYNNKGN